MYVNTHKTNRPQHLFSFTFSILLFSHLDAFPCYALDSPFDPCRDDEMNTPKLTLLLSIHTHIRTHVLGWRSSLTTETCHWFIWWHWCCRQAFIWPCVCVLSTISGWFSSGLKDFIIGYISSLNFEGPVQEIGLIWQSFLWFYVFT